MYCKNKNELFKFTVAEFQLKIEPVRINSTSYHLLNCLIA
jgi:hypothetical protein